jgi:hypothetical protein
MRNGSIESPRTSQNAGCTMALHANCTEVKKLDRDKYLFFKEFLFD